ncbi:MAG: 5-formyltetrahydrofolate cyclo-ligase [Sphingomonadales bacterium]|nr:5-formyltetrahydrofolate cyclo-ligase [Sphingomonadales bacterium]
MDEKKQLRSRLRQIRREHVAALPASTRALVLKRPPAPLVSLIPEGMTVSLYNAIGDEAPTLGWARWLHENGRSLALPWFAGREAPMTFRRWTDPWDDDALEPDPWGARQPDEAAEVVVPDVAVIPLLGFTARGERIGQGGGHYDRWLAEHPGVLRIGLGWDCQLVDSLPLEPHDLPLAAVVTPTRFYEGQT